MRKSKVEPKTKRRTKRQVMKAIYDAYNPYCLSKRLFQCGEPGNQLIDFEFSDYTRFLDNAPTLEDLIQGLGELSPFADDALDMAESMTAVDFATFKLALVHERRIAASLKDWDSDQMILIDVPGEEVPSSRMPPEFSVLLIPSKFMEGHMIAEKFQTSLTVAMSRIMEEKEAVHSM